MKNDKKHNKSEYYLPSKQFELRESLLIQLCDENRTVRSVYNTIIAFYIIFIISNTFSDVFDHRLPKALILLYHGFGKFHLAVGIWIGYNLVTLSTYFCFIVWAKIRQQVKTKKVWDNIWIFILIGYYILTFIITTSIISALNLPVASAAVTALESIRFLMKTHSFIRENTPKVLSQLKEKNIHLPKFSQFLYFLYAPTIIYRDEYPRSKTVRWDFIFSRIMEVIATVLFLAYWLEYINFPIFKEACKTKLSFTELCVLFLQFSIQSYLILWLIFILIVHSTQNAVGEALRFGDRLFYTDWWTSTDVRQYYKKWNWVVKDWLYTYVYKDLYQIVLPGNKYFARFSTLLLSALVHEWIYTVAVGYFLPLQLAFILTSAMLFQFPFDERSSIAHIFFIFNVVLGSGIIVTFYSLEYFARQNISESHPLLSILWKHSCIHW